MAKIRTICIDTVTQIQENQYMEDRQKPGHDQWKDYGQDFWVFVTDLSRLGFELILIIGPPGTGKSTGMMTLNKGTNMWFNADNKNPVWTGGIAEYGRKNNPKFPFHVIPESYEEIIDLLEEGLEAGQFEEERFAIITGHTEIFKEGGAERVRLKTLGQLNNKMQVEAKLETVLYSNVLVKGGQTSYLLDTQNNGHNTCRSPMGMFEPRIPNDYQFIIDKMLEAQ